MSSIFDAQSSNFKVIEEHKREASAPPPACILELPTPVPSREVLTDAQLAEAKKVLWNNKFIGLKFPRERKFRIDPAIPSQTIGIISFVPSNGALPDKNGCFGVIKLRGNFGSEKEAQAYGEFLMRNHDSYAEYDLVRVGQEFPVMIDNSIYTETTVEVNLKAQVDEISHTMIKKKQQEERKEREDVEERHRRLVNKNTEEDREENIDDIEYYTTLRTRKAGLLHGIAEKKQQIKEAEEALIKVSEEVVKFDSTHPEYRDEYIVRYKKALEQIGTKVEDNPLVKYMKEDDDNVKTQKEAAANDNEEKEVSELKKRVATLNL
jgi:hypothetical protein